jgi:hypothetical protein
MTWVSSAGRNRWRTGGGTGGSGRDVRRTAAGGDPGGPGTGWGADCGGRGTDCGTDGGPAAPRAPAGGGTGGRRGAGRDGNRESGGGATG